jgi:Protein of unknown function DUF262
MTSSSELMGMQQLFTDCVMSIPPYQRSYAWEGRQWEDLWADVSDALDMDSDHFFGTLVLRKLENRLDSVGRSITAYELVDGQQRLTTTLLLILAMYSELCDHQGDLASQRAVGQALWTDFLEKDGVSRLELAGVNSEFFKRLVQHVHKGTIPPDDSRSTNQRLNSCLDFFRLRLKARLAATSDLLRFAAFLRNKLLVLRFVTGDEEFAIKTFQAVNDRGLQLTLLDKTKSLLMFYATKYLATDKALIAIIQDAFGQVYEAFDKSMELARQHGIRYLVDPSKRFSPSVPT